jgi:hypothetical protein
MLNGVLYAQTIQDLSGEHRIEVKASTQKLYEDTDNAGIISSQPLLQGSSSVFIFQRQSDGSYRIKVKGSNRYWHVDGSGDELLSTRYQPIDDYTRFFFEGQTDGSYRIRLKATNKYLHEDGNGDAIISTRYQPNDDHTRFILRLPPPPPRAAIQSFSILTYNVMLLNRTFFTNHEHNFRAEEISNAINRDEVPFDVVVFNEAFDNESREILAAKMRLAGFGFTTTVVDQPGNTDDGGVFIQSRHRIEAQDQIVFTANSGFDGLANKGASGLSSLDFRVDYGVFFHLAALLKSSSSYG